jgi:hypothetical protein
VELVGKTEIEVTFELNSADVIRVFEALTSEPFEMRGTQFAVHPKPFRSVLHFYLHPTDDQVVRRLRVKKRKGTLNLSLETKRTISATDTRSEKEETLEEGGLPLGRAVEILLSGAPVVSSFIKNQYRLAFRSGNSGCKASIDQVIPFPADDPRRAGREVWHLEFENVTNWDPSYFLRSAYFMQHLKDFVRPLTASKWQTARMGPPAAPAVTREPQAIAAYFNALLKEGGRRRLGESPELRSTWLDRRRRIASVTS